MFKYKCIKINGAHQLKNIKFAKCVQCASFTQSPTQCSPLFSRIERLQITTTQLCIGDWQIHNFKIPTLQYCSDMSSSEHRPSVQIQKCRCLAIKIRYVGNFMICVTLCICEECTFWRCSCPSREATQYKSVNISISWLLPLSFNFTCATYLYIVTSYTLL